MRTATEARMMRVKRPAASATVLFQTSGAWAMRRVRTVAIPDSVTTWTAIRRANRV
jgi:hypothetical protein